MVCTFEKKIFENTNTGYCVAAFKTDDETAVPKDARSKYMLYDNKLNTGAESAEKITELKNRMAAIGYEIVCDRGDVKQ